MTAIRIRKRIDSETLHLPELRPLIGKTVEIVVREESTETEKNWGPLLDAAGQDLVDPNVYKESREFDRQHNKPPER
ncbi:MAG: hypothetical protein ACREJB_17145 [Planctomycetaceae bacterium]